jgi:hypothetical protein
VSETLSILGLFEEFVESRLIFGSKCSIFYAARIELHCLLRRGYDTRSLIFEELISL